MVNPFTLAVLVNASAPDVVLQATPEADTEVLDKLFKILPLITQLFVVGVAAVPVTAFARAGVITISSINTLAATEPNFILPGLVPVPAGMVKLSVFQPVLVDLLTLEATESVPVVNWLAPAPAVL